MSRDFLADMANSSRERVRHAQATQSLAALRESALALPRASALTLSRDGFDVIAELKLRSPAVGQLAAAEHTDIDARIAGYASAGAAAISVLTEPSRFDGSLTHLSQAAAALAGRAGLMRKDFLVDSYQVYEARAAGANGVLIILRMLSPEQCAQLIETCAGLGMFALLEAFDEAELQLAGQLVARYGATTTLLVGVNCRDLVTLQVVPGRLERLACALPVGCAGVAESGVELPADAARLAALGYRLALVGSALMRAADADGLLRALLTAGRGARQGRS